MAASRVRAGAGWLTFAAVILIMAGIMRVFDAIWAFDKDDELGERLQVLLYDDNLTAYGWLWLIVGILLILAGFGVVTGSQPARWFGVFMAAVAGISSMLWIYEFPIWALVGVVISFSVIYALTVYGDRDTVERIEG